MSDIITHRPLPRRSGTELDESIRNAVLLWAEATSASESLRYKGLVRMKTAAVDDFFSWIGRQPGEVTPLEVRAWRAELEQRNLAQATVYARLSFLSSFYTWLIVDPALAGRVGANPVRHARPKAPRAYQTKSAKALSDEQLHRLLMVVRTYAESGGLARLRDYALFLFFIFSGMRRAEVLRLEGPDLDLREQGIVVTCRVKGGDYVSRLVASPAVRAALLEYLAASHRRHVLETGGPLWTRHDRAGKPGAALSEWAFARRMKGYAREAGLDHFHLHQTRHTFARIVAESSGSFLETQDALGHKNPATTRAYIQRIAVKRDKFGDEIARRLKM